MAGSERKSSSETPLSLGTVVGGDIGDPTTVFIRESSFQAALTGISSTTDSEAELLEIFSPETKTND